MKYNSALAIIGPTGVGKTAVAFELARRVGVGEVINLDKMFLYRHFPIASGLSDALKETGVNRNLYKLLEPDEDPIPAGEYIGMVRNTCAKILSGGGLPIIEGGSTTYAPALLEANLENKFCDPVIGLRFPAGFDLKEKINKRIEAALREGLIDEVKEGLKKYRHTLIMSDAHSIVPLVRYLDGEIDLDQAKEGILDRCLKYAERQMEVLMQYPQITWLDYDPALLSQTVEKILAKIKAS